MGAFISLIGMSVMTASYFDSASLGWLVFWAAGYIAEVTECFGTHKSAPKDE